MTTVTRSRDEVDSALFDLQDVRIVAKKAHGGESTIVSSAALSVRRGESIGIVGESGSGKSMTAKALIGLLPPGVHASGQLLYRGENLLDADERRWQAIRGREVGLILQDPFTMLNPVMRCGRILEESLLPESIRDGRTPREEALRRLAEVGITDESVIDRYPFQLSGGMRQRVGIAAALCRDPRVLIADEPSTALDAATQREVLDLIKRIQQARGMGLILITHDLRVAFDTCNRLYVLYAGSLVEVGDAQQLQAEPLHPYTQGLLLSEPPVGRRVEKLVAMPGSVPIADEVQGKCTFEPRCRWAGPECRDGAPALAEVAPDRLSACVKLPEIRQEMNSLRTFAEQVAEVTAADRPEPILQVREVGKTFGAGTHGVRALDEVSIQVGRNESVGIVGESGSGKTTLARVLVGLETPTEGEIVIDGTTFGEWAKVRPEQRRTMRSNVQTVFQDPYSSLNPMRTVGWTLREAVVTHDHEAANPKQRVGELLEMVGLPAGYARRLPRALSGGERQRVAIARALAVRPKVLICDEPTSALDMSVQAQILNVLTTLRAEQDISYLFISHDLAIVRHVSEFVYVMYRGRVVESGPTDVVLDDPKHEYTRKLLESIPGEPG
ncbi:dipeptide ABC transporter ATP-binding protein [Amycolatopsis panacis]|uniref:ABC transporter ATP-binding protein n=1 Tax=Amycolatopsis panacis TaxID=2340917 RepID=A0A419HY51_9PSEU|nr:ABC transporter ATP-binding protein [Amycolatopsis panacis]RJQ82108.1 ABC transporter ATP-binding protein [Amycolatopsis panacis]